MTVRWASEGDRWVRGDGGAVYVQLYEGVTWWAVWVVDPEAEESYGEPMTWPVSAHHDSAAAAMEWADHWVAWQGEATVEAWERALEQRDTLQRIVGEVELALQGKTNPEWGLIAQQVASLWAEEGALQGQIDAVADALEDAGISPAIGGEADAVRELGRGLEEARR